MAHETAGNREAYLVRRCASRTLLTLLLAVAGCGGGGGGPEGGGAPSLASARTLAYVVTQCREDVARRSFQQELRIREGDRAPVTVAAATDGIVQEPPVLPGWCRLFGTSRIGSSSVTAGAFQRLGVSPDGSGVVFEKTTRFSIAIGRLALAPDDEGFFFVHADGSGLRRLGPASREKYDNTTPLSFSADGRTVAFADVGPGPAGEDAAQVVTLDVATGKRFQVTHLPPATPVDLSRVDIHTVRFLPDGRITFGTSGNLGYTVRPDGTDLTPEPLPVVLPGGRIDPTFHITGDLVTAVNLDLSASVSEVFLLDHTNLLQLTNFHRFDTLRGTVDVDGQRVFLIAAANPPELGGSNPSANCQIFSIDTQGTDLRQLTHFSQGGHSAFGCGTFGGLPPGCVVEAPRQEPTTRVLVFPSSCDPLEGANPNGEQVFAMYPDGTGLQQLTNTSGFTTEADGTVDVELPGPFASTAVRR